MQARNTEPALTFARLATALLIAIRCLGAWGVFAVSTVHAATRPAMVELEMQGLRNALNQSRDPAEGVYEVPARQTALLTGDGQYRLITDTRYPGNITFQFLEVGSPAGSRTIDLLKWRGGIEIQRENAATARKSYADLLFFAPALLLQLSDQRASGGEAADGTRVVTLLDPANRPATIAIDGKSGDVVRAQSDKLSYEYSGYVVLDGLRQPGLIKVNNGDRVVARWLVTAKTAAPVAAAFELPAGYVESNPRGSLRATRIAAGVYRVDGTPSGYHTGFVVGAHGVAVFDAPIGPEDAAKVKDVIEQTAPGLKITHVVLSHGHRDHIAGLPSYLQDKAVQVMVGAGGTQALKRQLGADAAARATEILADTVIDLGGRAVSLFPLPSTHANDMLVAYDQGSRTIFHGDLFYLPEVGPVPPAFEGSVELQDLIAGRHLQVKHLVGVHGRSGTDEDLRTSIALRAAHPE